VPFALLKTQETRGGGKIKGYIGWHLIAIKNT
jgi:hypothetical protein